MPLMSYVTLGKLSTILCLCFYSPHKVVVKKKDVTFIKWKENSWQILGVQAISVIINLWETLFSHL